MAKKITSIFLINVIILTSLLGFAGCSKKNTKTILTEPISIEFVDGEAFRFGEYKIGIDTFMLYALDIAPMFINQFGEDCWAQESIDLGWRREAPQKAFILYATDIIASSVACDAYYKSKGDLKDSIKEAFEKIAHERHEELLDAGMPEGVVTEESIYEYLCSTQRLNDVLDELNEANEGNEELVQYAVMAMRDAIDENFDYDKNINWNLVEAIDYSVVSEINDDQTVEQ